MSAPEPTRKESAAPRRRLLGRALACQRGETILTFAYVLPILLGLSFAILEFTLIMFDYHRAGEATRRAARLATIVAPVADLADLESGTVVTCTAAGGTLSCGAANVTSQQSFDDVLAYMQAILPNIQAANVELTYSPSGLGDPATPGGILPLVTVRLAGLQYAFTVLNFVPGMPIAITFPPFTTSYLASGKET
jgi:Flp pilus assembly protein TadG